MNSKGRVNVMRSHHRPAALTFRTLLRRRKGRVHRLLSLIATLLILTSPSNTPTLPVLSDILGSLDIRISVPSNSVANAAQASVTTTPPATATATPTTTRTPIIEQPPPPTYTIGLPTVAPTVTPIPDTNYQDQAIEAERDTLLAEVAALPALTGTVTGTVTSALVTGLTGGRLTSPDGSFTLGIMPGTVPATQTLYLQMGRVSFPQDDARASRGGYPLAYTFELTATRGIGGPPVEQFGKEVALVWNVDANALAAAGVKGFPYKVYTYDEQRGIWLEVLSTWKPETNQLIVSTWHFSLYAVGSGFEQVNNYLPTVNDFETDLQSGAATIRYPLNLPQGPGGFGPSVSLSYSSGNVDRVDATNQGTSSIGWGWSLSTNYIAATQHHFYPSGPLSVGYHPWSASIVVDGINGDLVLGQDGYWHTSNESFARIVYHEGEDRNRTTDWWEAWGKDGTHYVFDKRALTCDPHLTSGPPTPGCPNDRGDLTTYKWMLSSATDVNGNTIEYSYLYEGPSPSATPYPSPITDDKTRAVYPHQIRYGTNDGQRGSKVLVQFELAKDANGNLKVRDDISQYDDEGGVYQSYYINKITVKRLIATPQPTPTVSPTPDPSGYVLLRSYELQQSYDVKLVLPTPATGTPTATPCPNWQCKHLTLNSIVTRGNDGQQLPSTSFEYVLEDSQHSHCRDQGPSYRDVGKLCRAKNGYGGRVDYYYDAAGGSVNQGYRRVWKKEVRDGLGESPPHKVSYLYDHRGAITNLVQISDEASVSTPRHAEDTQFRGFGWARVQSPLDEAEGTYHSTDHYFSQTDEFNGKEWRVQSGKGRDFYDDMDTQPTSTPNPNWTIHGTVQPVVDPLDNGNTVWKLVPEVSDPTATPATYIERTKAITDGMDVAIRFLLKGSEEHPYKVESTWKLTNQSGFGDPTDYWGLKVVPGYDAQSLPAFHAKVIWSKDGQYGERDLAYTNNPLTPRMRAPLAINKWYWVHLHASPDGRIAVQLYRVQDAGEPFSGTKDFIMVKSGDAATSGGDPNGKIPNFGSHLTTEPKLWGKNWKFRQEVRALDADYGFLVLADDYEETRTLFSQSDTVYEDRTPVLAAGYTSEHRVGLANNLRGMNIRFVPPVEGWTSLYGAAFDDDPNQHKEYTSRRSRQIYDYDGYGNRTLVNDYGKIADTADERSTVSQYATPHPSGRYIVNKIGQTDVYNGIQPPGIDTRRMAQTRYYYDGEDNHGQIPENGRGLVTKVEQVGVDPNDGSITLSRSAQRFDYDSYGNRTKVYDPNDNMTETVYDPYYHAFPVEVIYPNGRSEYTSWNYAVDMPRTTTDMNNVVTGYAYDPFGRPSKTWIGTLGSDTNPNDRYFFPDLGQTSVTPPFYISYQHRVGATQGDMTWQTRWYDGRGRTVQDVSPKDNQYVIVVDSVYTDTGQIYSTTLPYLAAAVSPTATVQPIPNQPRVLNYYDGLGRTTMAINPDNTYTLNDYGALLYTASVDEGGVNVKVQHTDMYGRVDKAYDRDTTVMTSIKELEVQYQYDALDRLVRAVRDPSEPSGIGIVAYTYYDDLGRKSRMIDPDMGTWQYNYDAAGNLIEQRDARCIDPANNCIDPTHQVFFRYDNMNRVVGKYYGATHNANNVADVKYYYDNQYLGNTDADNNKSWGRLRAAEVTVQGQGTDKANGNGYSYDQRGALVQEVITTTLSSRTYTMTHGYDVGGRPTTLTYPNPGTPEQVTTAYNTQGPGLPTSLFSSLGGPLPVRSATYNTRGQLDVLQQGSNSGPMTDNLFTDFDYDDSTTKRGWLTKTKVDTAGGTELLNLNMSYSPNGNVTQVQQTATGGTNNPTFTNTYTYDGFNRLIEATSTNISLFPTEVYTYTSSTDPTRIDGLGRMTSRSIGGTHYDYTYNNSDKPDAPRSYRGNSYTYDENGSQTVRTGNSITQTRHFDPEGRLWKIEQSSGGSTTTTEMVYDASGGRLVKSVTPGGGSTARTLYIGNLYEEELTGSTQPPYTVYYHFAGRMVGMRKGFQPDSHANGQLRVVGDHLGSTTLVVDTSSSPSVVHRVYYKPYGEEIEIAGNRRTTIGFTGQRLDTESGLMHFGARFYDPVLSRFISADPAPPNKLDPKSRERYSYALNNPLRYTDATGLTPEDEFGAQAQSILNNLPHSGYLDTGAVVSEYLGDYSTHAVPPDDERNNYAKCLRGIRSACLADFAALGITITGAWELWELIEALTAVHDLLRAAGWSYADFRHAMGIDAGKQLIFHRVRGPGPSKCGDGGDAQCDEIAAWAIPLVPLPSTPQGGTLIEFFDQTFARGKEFARVTVVHELAHAWDYANNTGLSIKMMLATGSGYELYHEPCNSLGVCLKMRYNAPGAVSPYAQENHLEDFAETVTFMVYPEYYTRQSGFAQRAKHRHFGTRLSYVRALFGEVKKR